MKPILVVLLLLGAAALVANHTVYVTVNCTGPWPEAPYVHAGAQLTGNACYWAYGYASQVFEIEVSDLYPSSTVVAKVQWNGYEWTNSCHKGTPSTSITVTCPYPTELEDDDDPPNT